MQSVSGSADGISGSISMIDGVKKAAGGLTEAEQTAIVAKTGVFMTLNLVFAVETGATVPVADAIGDLALDQIKYWTDATGFKSGDELLKKAKARYEEALIVVQNNPGGIRNYEVARKYLDSYYKAYFLQSTGTGLLLPGKRISESEFVTVAKWIPDYINHLGEKIVSHISIWHKTGVFLTKAVDIGAAGVKSKEQAQNFLNILKEIEQQTVQLLEDESFPVDYTLALANRDVSTLFRWGIHGVDYIGYHVASPVELRVYDSNGNVTGIVNGETREEIPNSSYADGTATIFYPNDVYTAEVVGTGDGSYGLTVIRGGEQDSTLAVADVPVSANTRHQYTIESSTLKQPISKVTVKIDSDGDGTFEETKSLGLEKSSFPWVWVAVAGLTGLLGVLVGAFMVWRRIGKKQAAKT